MARRQPLTGSCLCGGVRFEVTAPFLWANHCHCSRCRKHSGAFGGTQGRVPRSGFSLLAGEELIEVYRPDDGRVKAFCRRCGSSLFGGDWPDGDEVAIRFGALPSAKVSPEKLIVASLREAGVGWLVRDVRPVGVPSRHRRQAEQFNSTGRVVGRAVDEIDLIAELVPTRGRRQPQ